MNRETQRGQTLVEMGLLVSLCVLIALGIVEFGYALTALEVVTQAVSAGGRAAAVLEVGSRGTCGTITDKSTIDGTTGIVRSQIGGVVTVNQVDVVQLPTPSTSSASCDTFTGSSVPTVTVTATGSIPYMFGLLGSSAFGFTRSATFRDEGR